MKKTLKEIASIIGGEIVGDESVQINNVNGIREAQEGDITFLANPLYKPLLGQTKASAVITSREIKSAAKPIIRTDNPSLAFSKAISIFKTDKEKTIPKGIDKAAIVAKDAVMGEGVAVCAYVVIEEGSQVGDGTVIYPHVYIGHNTKIGKNTKIYPNVSIREGSVIGDNVIIHSGTVIGSDGFGFVKVEGRYQKIPQTGTVAIEDDVEIGSNVSIDRARFGETVIGKGTKIDNLVQIAHNVRIGPNSIIVSQAGISGSSRLGKDVIVAGQVGIVGHVDIGDNVIIGAQSGVSKSVPANSIVMGSPVKPMMEEKKILACMRKLPELLKTVRELKIKMKT
ncbi:MAG: UDP-3-O-(3-hydroxymyristoyl)glucosamine N-acyltransferase [Candidatus Omnitrophota bacterium]